MLTPLVITGGGLLIPHVRHLADTGRGVVGLVANALVIVGAIAVGAVVTGGLVAGAAVLALIASACLLAIPLALVGRQRQQGHLARRYYRPSRHPTR
ncbi:MULTISPECIES: hypothetical protein [Nocardiaceae]|uniref:Major facilitator superfamily (MFS) profile domain-containing protein n=1 Tax=Rhodococcoides kroppenstedtii TaxID=293050 RepID=A0ABS7NVP5_9NOCA|nr:MULTISPECIES: hypothetical protein [Rhodococcus]AMY20073.1 hypothetical protein A3Q40_02706 [Rhodococcus sp. PBTS 1]MBY6314378.1 hypothetical protein [Rhodococcus kroppenstedtii]MBY6322074.1 hypothetical protein [Rhodococcus kroppenstedtii]MBY6400962.1 hypothetical protein [Rhodococcus kroppenstedtii]